MIIGIGCDLIEINRMKKALTLERFANRVFTVAEQECCEVRGRQKFSSYAARFAAKEAVLKALGTGLRGGKLLDIEIYNDCNGKPYINLSGYFAELADKRGVKKIYLSLSHTKEYAMAQVVLEGEI